MAKFKGTKGKWKIAKKHIFNQGGLFQVPIYGNDKKNRAVCNVFGVTELEGKANALLIYKAPEMLQMLQRIDEDTSFGTANDYMELSNLIKEVTEL